MKKITSAIIFLLTDSIYTGELYRCRNKNRYLVKFCYDKRGVVIDGKLDSGKTMERLGDYTIINGIKIREKKMVHKMITCFTKCDLDKSNSIRGRYISNFK